MSGHVWSVHINVINLDLNDNDNFNLNFHNNVRGSCAREHADRSSASLCMAPEFLWTPGTR